MPPDGFSSGSVPVTTTVALKSELKTLAGAPTAWFAAATPLVNGPMPSAEAAAGAQISSAATRGDFRRIVIVSLSFIGILGTHGAASGRRRCAVLLEAVPAQRPCRRAR